MADQLLLPEEELSLFFERVERVERFAPTAPDFFVEEVRLEAAAVRVLAPELFDEPLFEDLARLADERAEVPPVFRAPDFAPEERALDLADDLAPDFLVADDRVPDFAADERPLDLVPLDREADDRVPDFAPEDFDLVPLDLELEDFLAEERALAALVPEDLVPDFAPALFFPVDLDFAEELFVPPDFELLRADVPLLFRAVLEDFDEPLRERLPLPLEDELPPEFSLWLVFDLSSVGICRLLLTPSRSEPPRLQGNVDICARFQATSSKRSRAPRSSKPRIVEEGPLTSGMFCTRSACRAARNDGSPKRSAALARFRRFATCLKYRCYLSRLVDRKSRKLVETTSIARARSSARPFRGSAIFVEEEHVGSGVRIDSPCPKIFFERCNFHVDCRPDVRRALGIGRKVGKRALHAATRSR